MWNEVYLEEGIKDHPRALAILEKLGKTPLLIPRYDEIWGRSKKPYLQKRDTLNLFLARKEGQLLKLAPDAYGAGRSEEHTSELQSRENLVCRLLLEKKKKHTRTINKAF